VTKEFCLVAQIFLLSTINTKGQLYKMDFDEQILVNISLFLPIIFYSVKNGIILVGSSIECLRELRIEEVLF
jgi:hypothetical protein